MRKTKRLTEAELFEQKVMDKAIKDEKAAIERALQIKRDVAEELAFQRRQHPLFLKNRNRNRPCICGSCIKFKKCCLRKIPANTAWIPTRIKTWRI